MPSEQRRHLYENRRPSIGLSQYTSYMSSIWPGGKTSHAWLHITTTAQTYTGCL